ncbi:hypothetical protein L0F63_007125 [Massospora cicadina]|nr:hypothetical protein L0F63_007125 [Massospora cicadina]
MKITLITIASAIGINASNNYTPLNGCIWSCYSNNEVFLGGLGLYSHPNYQAIQCSSDFPCPRQLYHSDALCLQCVPVTSNLPLSSTVPFTSATPSASKPMTGSETATLVAPTSSGILSQSSSYVQTSVASSVEPTPSSVLVSSTAVSSSEPYTTKSSSKKSSTKSNLTSASDTDFAPTASSGLVMAVMLSALALLH